MKHKNDLTYESTFKKLTFSQQMCFIAFSRECAEFYNGFKSTRGLITAKSNVYCGQKHIFKT